MTENQQYQHYRRAMDLIAEGEGVVTHIRDVKDNRALKRKQLAESGETEWELHGELQREIAHLTERMDELGKKANGIWAQAQVHATLAQTPNFVLSAQWTPTTERKFGTEYLTAGRDQ